MKLFLVGFLIISNVFASEQTITFTTPLHLSKVAFERKCLLSEKMLNELSEKVSASCDLEKRRVTINFIMEENQNLIISKKLLGSEILDVIDGSYMGNLVMKKHFEVSPSTEFQYAGERYERGLAPLELILRDQTYYYFNNIDLVTDYQSLIPWLGDAFTDSKYRLSLDISTTSKAQTFMLLVY